MLNPDQVKEICALAITESYPVYAHPNTNTQIGLVVFGVNFERYMTRDIQEVLIEKFRPSRILHELNSNPVYDDDICSGGCVEFLDRKSKELGINFEDWAWNFGGYRELKRYFSNARKIDDFYVAAYLSYEASKQESLLFSMIDHKHVCDNGSLVLRILREGFNSKKGQLIKPTNHIFINQGEGIWSRLARRI